MGVFVKLLLLGTLLAWSLPASAADPLKLIDQARAKVAAGEMKHGLFMLEQAMQAVWERSPFYLRMAVLTEDKAQGFGIYQPKKQNSYPKNKAIIHIYVEPSGYRYQVQQGIYNFGLDMDVYLLDKTGKVLFGKEKFLKTDMRSRRPNREFFMNVTLTLTGAPPGDYVVKLAAQDKISQALAEIRVPISIK